MVSISCNSDPEVRAPPLHKYIVGTVPTPKVCHLSRKQSMKSILSLLAVKNECSEGSRGAFPACQGCGMLGQPWLTSIWFIAAPMSGDLLRVTQGAWDRAEVTPRHPQSHLGSGRNLLLKVIICIFFFLNGSWVKMKNRKWKKCSCKSYFLKNYYLANCNEMSLSPDSLIAGNRTGSSRGAAPASSEGHKAPHPDKNQFCRRPISY